MKTTVAPRIYCIPATAAPVVAVFRRGPTKWSHVGRWHLEQGTYESGAWLHGRLFPRRCDLSPDGQWLAYFAHHPHARWEHGETYIGISKLPWLTALHAFGTCGTWTRGYYFTENKSAADTAADHIELPISYGLTAIPVAQFANERRRGWRETPDSPQRHPQDRWDEQRNARLQKTQPGGDRTLVVERLSAPDTGAGMTQSVGGLHVRYSLVSEGSEPERLEDVQWADWDTSGQLLVATRCGKLQMRRLAGPQSQIIFEKDLTVLDPNPTPSPQWARNW